MKPQRHWTASLVLTWMLLVSAAFAYPDPADAPGWETVPAILLRISPPVFPAKDFDVTAFGGAGDGRTDNTEPFRKAITACSASARNMLGSYANGPPSSLPRRYFRSAGSRL